MKILVWAFQLMLVIGSSLALADPAVNTQDNAALYELDENERELVGIPNLAGPPAGFPRDGDLVLIRTRAKTNRDGEYLSIDGQNRVVLSGTANRNSYWRLQFGSSGRPENASYSMQNPATGLYIILTDDLPRQVVTSRSSPSKWQWWKAGGGPGRCPNGFVMRWLTQYRESWYLTTEDDGTVTTKKTDDLGPPEKCFYFWDYQDT